jgi:dTDP-4-dehydrorhamnose reductase
MAGHAFAPPRHGAGVKNVRALLLGGYGQLGTEIRRRWTDWKIDAPPHAEVDIEDGSAIAAAIERNRPDLLINCAAFHNVDRCEEVPDRALGVNAVAVDQMARLARDNDVEFLTISTDYVFDGTAKQPYEVGDPPRPISAYGVSKLAGELLVERLQSNAYVVRTCGVYGERASTTKGYTFIDRVVAQARANEPQRIVSDVFASPTFAGDLAEALQRLVRTHAYGLYHAVNPGPVSWYDFAREVLEQAGIDRTIEPISASEWKAPARRPAFSALANTKIAALGIAIPSWQEGIAAYLRLKSPMLNPP